MAAEYDDQICIKSETVKRLRRYTDPKRNDGFDGIINRALDAYDYCTEDPR